MAEQKKETIFDTYANITYFDAQARLSSRFSDKAGELPALASLKARRSFDEGDHWQKGEGFIGQLPTGDKSTERTELLRRAFSPEEVIAEVLDTHVENVLGNDPAISLEDAPENDATLEIVKAWFEKRENTKILAKALRAARRESASVLRAFIPSGMIDGEGRIKAKNLEEALSKIWIRHETIDKGGVIVDEATATELGLILYKIHIERAQISLCEYAYLNEIGSTVWGTASAHTTELGSEQAEPLQLNGLLPIYQLNAAALISDSACQAQRAVNLSGTMLTRNNNLAGSRERLAIGVQPPGEWKDDIDAETGLPKKTFEPAEMKTGPATFNFLSAMPIHDDSGNITGYGNPNVIFTDPVPVDTFLATSKHWREVIYSKAKMRHLLMSEDATASGLSRVEARNEFQASLNESKQLVDAAGRWMIEIALHIAAHFIGTPGKFAKVKTTFEAEVSTVKLTSEEISQIREDYRAGLIDLQTALELRGMKNVDEILKRVAAEKPKTLETQPVNDVTK